MSGLNQYVYQYTYQCGYLKYGTAYVTSTVTFIVRTLKGVNVNNNNKKNILRADFRTFFFLQSRLKLV